MDTKANRLTIHSSGEEYLHIEVAYERTNQPGIVSVRSNIRPTFGPLTSKSGFELQNFGDSVWIP